MGEREYRGWPAHCTAMESDPPYLLKRGARGSSLPPPGRSVKSCSGVASPQEAARGRHRRGQRVARTSGLTAAAPSPRADGFPRGRRHLLRLFRGKDGGQGGRLRCCLGHRLGDRRPCVIVGDWQQGRGRETKAAGVLDTRGVAGGGTKPTDTSTHYRGS